MSIEQSRGSGPHAFPRHSRKYRVHGVVRATVTTMPKCERFFGTRKGECVTRYVFETHEQAQHVVFEDVECFYHRLRSHSSLGSLSPTQFEQLNSSSLRFTLLSKRVNNMPLLPVAAWDAAVFLAARATPGLDTSQWLHLLLCVSQGCLNPVSW
jgi:hypothetical protein